MSQYRGIVSVRVQDRNNKLKNLDKALNFFGGGEQKSLAVGLIEGIASEESIFKGLVNDLGVPEKRIPARPWFSETMRKNSKKYERWLVAKMKKNWRLIAETGKGINKNGNELREELGEIIKADLKDAVDNSLKYFRRNAPRTIKKKGFDWPLVETGDMYDDIDYVLFSRRKK